MTAAWPLDVPPPSQAPRGERERRPALEGRSPNRWQVLLEGLGAACDVNEAQKGMLIHAVHMLAQCIVLVCQRAEERAAMEHELALAWESIEDLHLRLEASQRREALWERMAGELERRKRVALRALDRMADRAIVAEHKLKTRR